MTKSEWMKELDIINRLMKDLPHTCTVKIEVSRTGISFELYHNDKPVPYPNDGDSYSGSDTIAEELEAIVTTAKNMDRAASWTSWGMGFISPMVMS